MWCWGGNFIGEAGQPIGDLVLTPRRVDGVPPMRRVLAAMERTCAVSTTDELWCWGAAVRMAGRPIAGAARVATGVTGAVALDDDAVCAAFDADVRCWTRPEDPTVPAAIVAAPATVELVVLQGVVAARDRAGRVRVLDWNHGADLTSAAPWHPDLLLDRPATAIVGGGPRLCVLTDGVIRCRGNRARVDLPTVGATALAANATTLCAMIDGALRCSGELAAATDAWAPVPAPGPAPNGGNAVGRQAVAAITNQATSDARVGTARW